MNQTGVPYAYTTFSSRHVNWGFTQSGKTRGSLLLRAVNLVFGAHLAVPQYGISFSVFACVYGRGWYQSECLYPVRMRFK